MIASGWSFSGGFEYSRPVTADRMADEMNALASSGTWGPPFKKGDAVIDASEGL